MRSNGIRIATLCTLLSCALLCLPTRADEKLRPKRPEQLRDAEKDPFVRVLEHNGRRPRVAYADYDAIRRDFKELKHASDGAINDWIIENFAYVSRAQLQLSGIRSSEFSVDGSPGSERNGYRPEQYNRAAVLEAFHRGSRIGLVDLKGVGHRASQKNWIDQQIAKFKAAIGNPAALDALRTQDHDDGLMRLNEGITEVTRQKMLQRLYDIHNARHGTNHQTIESYFLLELPFDVLGPNGERCPAAIVGRQAHWRSRASINELPYFRHPSGHFPQGSLFGAIVDFGTVILDTVPKLTKVFGLEPGRTGEDPVDMHDSIEAGNIAQRFRDGQQGAIWEHVHGMLGLLDDEWNSVDKSVRDRRPRYIDLFEAFEAPVHDEALWHELRSFLENDSNMIWRELLADVIHPENLPRALAYPALVEASDFTRDRRNEIASWAKERPVLAHPLRHFLPAAPAPSAAPTARPLPEAPVSSAPRTTQGSLLSRCFSRLAGRQ